MSAQEKGTTLVELIIVMVMISASVAMLTLLFPKASESITDNRHRMLANTFASTLVQKQMNQPYALLQPSDPSLFTGAAAAQCDCRQQNFALWQVVESTYTEDGINYTRKLCVDFVEPSAGGGWNKYCPDGPPVTSASDKGMKNIRVQVTWAAGGNTLSTEMESMLTRP